MSSYMIKVDVAKRLWEIAGISPEHGNALMDLIGYDNYVNVMNLHKEDQDLNEEAE